MAVRSERGGIARKRGKTTTVDLVAHIDEADLETTFPELIEEKTEAVFLPERGRVVGVRRKYYDGLILRERAGAEVSPEEKAEVLFAVAKDRFESIFDPDEETRALIHRLAFARRHIPERIWPEVERGDLIERLKELCVGMSSLEEVGRIDWKGAILGTMSFEDRKALDSHLPERIRVPSGSMKKLDYSGTAGKGPVLAVKIQELFGLMETPTVAMGRVPVLLHLLAPNNRPVQITEDLRSFWLNTYAQVKKDLKGRYPKHPWPDDPLTADATAKTKRRRH